VRVKEELKEKNYMLEAEINTAPSIKILVAEDETSLRTILKKNVPEKRL